MRSLWVGAALAVLVVLVSGCLEGRNDLPMSPLKLTLSYSGEPRVNNTFALIATFGLREGAYYIEGLFDDTTLNITLPGSIDVVSGDINWVGRIDNDTHKSVTLTSQLVIRKEGGYQIEGFLKGPTIRNTWWGDHKGLYIESSLFGYSVDSWAPVSTYSQGIMITEPGSVTNDGSL